MTGRPAGNGQDALRKALARWEFTRHAPARYWGSGALPDAEAAAYEAADELLALPELEAWAERRARKHAAGELTDLAFSLLDRGLPNLVFDKIVAARDALVVNAPSGAADC